MGRAPCCEKVGIKKGRWTDEEDEILMKYIQANGEGSWRSLPKNAGLSRCGKSCRLRWINYLRSDLKRGSISPEEEEIIIRLHSTLGNRWSLIAAQLPGRTDNEIKNYWNSHLSRKIQSFRRSIGSEPDFEMIMNTPLPRKRRGGRTSRAAMKKTKSYTCRNLNGPIPTTMSTNHSSSFNSTNNNTASNTIYFNYTTLPVAPAGPATLESLTLSSGKYMYSPYQGDIEVRDLEEGEPQNLMFGGHNQEVGLAPESGTMSFCNNDIMVAPHGLDPQGVVLTLDEDNGVKQNGKMVNRSEDLESGVTTSSYLDEERFDWEWEGAGVADWRDHDHLWSNGDQTDQMLSWMWDIDEIDAEYPNFAGDTDSQKQEALVAWLLS